MPNASLQPVSFSLVPVVPTVCLRMRATIQRGTEPEAQHACTAPRLKDSWPRLLPPCPCNHPAGPSVRNLAPMPASLRDAWLSGDAGKLSPLETLKAWALKRVYLDEGYSEKGICVKIAHKVQKVGGGSPGPDAVRKLLLKIGADREWYPGKLMGHKRGRKPALSPLARAAIKRCAEAMKANDLEPTYPLVVARCPQAVRNPETGEPVDKQAVYDIFRTSCFDPGAQAPWDHCPRVQKTALSEEVMAKRKAWAVHMRDDVSHSERWYYQHVMWTDICHSLLPRTVAKAKEQALARKGKKAWLSKDKQLYARNLKGNQQALNHNSWASSGSGGSPCSPVGNCMWSCSQKLSRGRSQRASMIW